jgi:hypothetical protein
MTKSTVIFKPNEAIGFIELRVAVHSCFMLKVFSNRRPFFKRLTLAAFLLYALGISYEYDQKMSSIICLERYLDLVLQLLLSLIRS